jgi:hypothetical protein
MNTSIATPGVNASANNLRCHAGNLAILSGKFGTRIVRIVGRAADIYYDWKVEILGSPIWIIDARSDKPQLSNLGFANDCSLFPLEAEAEAEEVCHA